jgi:hypothetical protein
LKACILTLWWTLQVHSKTMAMTHTELPRQTARERGHFIISGASTCPALTAAVVRRLTIDLVGVAAIEAGIAPSPHVEVGFSVIRALTSYAGRSLRLLQSEKETYGNAGIIGGRLQEHDQRCKN